MLTIQDMISRLTDVKERRPGQYTSRCPCSRNHANGDKTRSFEFSLDRQTGKILAYCHLGCSIEDICSEMGCSVSDLMPAPSPEQKKISFLEWWATAQGEHNTLEAVYSYDYDGFHDGLCKAKFRKPDGEKWYIWIKDDESKPSGISFSRTGCPNRLFVQGTTKDDHWFIVEGEKDAVSLHRATGATVASTENGASKNGRGKKWSEKYNAQIAGKSVFILNDNDEAGRHHAEMQAAMMEKVAAHVYTIDILSIWPDCPEKGDISDAIKALGASEVKKRLFEIIPTLSERNPLNDSLSMENQTEAAPLPDVVGDEQTPAPAEPEPEPLPMPEPQGAPIEAEPPTLNQDLSRQPASAIFSIDKFMKKVRGESYRPIPTGIREFDALIDGGFIRQTLVTLGASPGAGKTVIVQQICEAIAGNRQADILYFNLEMSEEQLLARSISRATGIPQTEVLRGYSWTEEQRSKIIAAADAYKRNIAPFIAYNPTETETACYEDILDAMNLQASLRDPRKPLICVIDYLQLLRDRNGNDDVIVIKDALKRFKDFAISHNAVVFLIMAHNRASNNSGIVSQGAGRDTSAIEYSGDLQLSLNYGGIVDGTFRDLEDMRKKINGDKYPQIDESWYNYRCLSVTKNRFGRDRATCYLTFHGNESRFDFSTRCRRVRRSKPVPSGHIAV